MSYYIGLDAGGTKTECVLARDETELARATGGTIKLLRVSVLEAENTLDAVLNSVSTQSGVSLDSITATCAGAAGFSVPRIPAWIKGALSARVSGKVLVTGDEQIALDGAFKGGAGVLVIAGTGSNIVARASSGELIRVGGWGPGVADEGSGTWIGMRAVRAVFDAIDRDERTELLEQVMSHWNLASVSELVDISNQSPAPNFSALTPLVLECARHGDERAQAVLVEAGRLLGMYAALAVQRMRRLEPRDSSAPRIAYTGSVVARATTVREAMCEELLRRIPEAIVLDKAADPLQGALWRARRA